MNDLDVWSETVPFLAAPLSDVFCLLCKNWWCHGTEAEALSSKHPETSDSAVLNHVHPFSLVTRLKPPQHVDRRPRHAAYTSPQVQRQGSLRMTELLMT